MIKSADSGQGVRVEFTKSRARRSNDNALVETKNGAVVRKWLGYQFLPSEATQSVERFYREFLNPYLTFHRPCPGEKTAAQTVRLLRVLDQTSKNVTPPDSGAASTRAGKPLRAAARAADSRLRPAARDAPSCAARTAVAPSPGASAPNTARHAVARAHSDSWACRRRVRAEPRCHAIPQDECESARTAGPTPNTC